MKNRFTKNLLCVFLCLVMILSAALVGCNGETSEVTGEAPGEMIDVVRLKVDLKAGAKITEDKVEVVSVHKAELAEGVIPASADVIGKFALTEMYAGDYFTSNKITNVRKTTNEDGVTEEDLVLNFDDAGYVLVSDYVKPDSGKDVSDDIQKLINDNPNRTLYFPDGVYLLSKPITTSADPEKTVSFQLSNYAHFRPMDTWKKGENGETQPMLHLGATDMKEGIVNSGNHYSVQGGIFDGNDQVDAIWVSNAGDVSLRYISIKNCVKGIHVKSDEDGNGPVVDVHTVNIVGSDTVDSIGIILESNYNTLTNMRIASNQIAVMVSGTDNLLRNLHPLYAFRDSMDWKNTYNDSVAFYDVGTRNFYDNCYNDQFATGFYMGKDTASIYDCCFNFWYRGTRDDDGFVLDHNSFVAEGQFNSTIRYTSCEFGHGKPVVTDKQNFPIPSNCNFLLVGEAGGKGTIDTVYFKSANTSDADAAFDYIVEGTHIER